MSSRTIHKPPPRPPQRQNMGYKTNNVNNSEYILRQKLFNLEERYKQIKSENNILKSKNNGLQSKLNKYEYKSNTINHDYNIITSIKNENKILKDKID